MEKLLFVREGCPVCEEVKELKLSNVQIVEPLTNIDDAALAALYDVFVFPSYVEVDEEGLVVVSFEGEDVKNYLEKP